MARPNKQGLDYFPHDVEATNDEKIEALRFCFGNIGYALYFMLLEKIYKNGGYFSLPKGSMKKILINKFMVDEDTYENFIKECIELELFDKELFEKGILSSKRILNTIDMINEKRFKWRKKKIGYETIEGEELSIGEKIITAMVRIIGREPTMFERVELEKLYNEYDDELIKALEKAKEQNKFSIAYIKAILNPNKNDKVMEKIKNKLKEQEK